MSPTSDLLLCSAGTGAVVGLGMLFAGYRWGAAASKGRPSVLNESWRKNQEIGKSYYDKDSPRAKVLHYCLEHSTPMHPVMARLQEDTKSHRMAMMMGAPEVISVNAAFIKHSGARKVLDVGVFTGASSLSAALAMPEDGRVVALDVSEEYTKQAEIYWAEAGVRHKIDLRIAPAADTLRDLLENGEEGSFDFAFIDADKPNYDTYYELCLTLLRTGGIIAIDNTLWSGTVMDPLATNPGASDLRALNEKIRKDSRVNATQLNVGDGYTIVVKL